jgi:hypothetical protein
LLSLLHKKAAKAIVVNWGEYEDPNKVLGNVATIMDGKKVAPIVDYLTKKPTQDELKENEFIYSDEAQIQSNYQRILSKDNNSTELKSMKSFSSVYIPKDIMNVNPASKGVVEVHRKRYNIQFFENPYKRVVMWHLSQHQNVYFY